MKFQMVDPEKISMGSINPRLYLGVTDDLVASMRERLERGQRPVVLPLLVRKIETDLHDFEIIDGKRRLQSALQLRLPEVPVVEETDTDSARELIIMSYLSNEGRKDFHWTERAQTFKKLHDDFGMTHEEIGSAVGYSRQRVSDYIRVFESLSEKGRLAVVPIDMETVKEIVQKCPEQDVPDLIAYTIERDISRDDMRKILFALRNFYASQEVVKDFHKGLHDELQEKYHPWRFNPKFLALYQKEKTLRTGDLAPVDYYLDIGDYPTRESANQFALEHHGEVLGEVHRDGWHLRIYPYLGEDVDTKFNEFVEKFS